MYKDGDLDIHPNFQRFFRWELPQKSRLIESFLLNFPVPPIFVNQREDGIWDVVDGLQRISTILEFVGIYKDAEGNVLPPLKLCGTKLLPSLEGKLYESRGDNDDSDDSFTEIEQRFLKRTRLDFIILKKESDNDGKYEVFQRLNTGGTSLSDQEFRNCLIVMSDPEKFQILNNMSNYDNFKNIVNLTDKSLKERFDLELITRYVCLRHEPNLAKLKGVSDFGEYLDDKIVSIVSDDSFDWKREVRIFNKTFDYISDELGTDAFQKYDLKNDRFIGGFYTSVFEIIAITIGRHEAESISGNLKSKIKGLWKKIEEDDLTWKGSNASSRIQRTISLGDKLYEEDQK